jgi:hypothetical protein
VKGAALTRSPRNLPAERKKALIGYSEQGPIVSTAD